MPFVFILYEPDFLSLFRFWSMTEEIMGRFDQWKELEAKTHAEFLQTLHMHGCG